MRVEDSDTDSEPGWGLRNLSVNLNLILNAKRVLGGKAVEGILSKLTEKSSL